VVSENPTAAHAGQVNVPADFLENNGVLTFVDTGEAPNFLMDDDPVFSIGVEPVFLLVLVSPDLPKFLTSFTNVGIESSKGTIPSRNSLHCTAISFNSGTNSH
jgi:hypothetical protein